jgi:hypothetical protein
MRARVQCDLRTGGRHLGVDGLTAAAATTGHMPRRSSGAWPPALWRYRCRCSPGAPPDACRSGRTPPCRRHERIRLRTARSIAPAGRPAPAPAAGMRRGRERLPRPPRRASRAGASPCWPARPRRVPPGRGPGAAGVQALGLHQGRARPWSSPRAVCREPAVRADAAARPSGQRALAPATHPQLQRLRYIAQRMIPFTDQVQRARAQVALGGQPAGQPASSTPSACPAARSLFSRHPGQAAARATTRSRPSWATRSRTRCWSMRASRSARTSSPPGRAAPAARPCSGSATWAASPRRSAPSS